MSEKNKNIVVIEDDPVLRELTQIALSLEGYQVDVFEDGSKGIGYLEKNIQNVDLILLDLFMPILDGMQVLNWIKANQHSDVNVVVMTAMIDELTEKSLLSAGANKVIQKPLDMSLLYSSVKEFLIS